MMAALQFNRERVSAAVSDPFLLATDLAEELVLKGIPFRNAHDIVGKLASESSKTGVPLDQLPAEFLKQQCPELIEGWSELFNPLRSLAARTAPGAPSPENVSKRLAHWREVLAPRQGAVA